MPQHPGSAHAKERQRVRSQRAAQKEQDRIEAAKPFVARERAKAERAARTRFLTAEPIKGKDFNKAAKTATKPKAKRGGAGTRSKPKSSRAATKKPGVFERLSKTSNTPFTKTISGRKALSKVKRPTATKAKRKPISTPLPASRGLSRQEVLEARSKADRSARSKSKARGAVVRGMTGDEVTLAIRRAKVKDIVTSTAKQSAADNKRARRKQLKKTTKELGLDKLIDQGNRLKKKAR